MAASVICSSSNRASRTAVSSPTVIGTRWWFSFHCSISRARRSARSSPSAPATNPRTGTPARRQPMLRRCPARTRSRPSGRRTMVIGTWLPHPSGRDAAIVVHRATSALVTVACALVRALASISRSPGLYACKMIGSVVVSDMACSFQRELCGPPRRGPASAAAAPLARQVLSRSRVRSTCRRQPEGPGP